jgi:hypothetical protein
MSDSDFDLTKLRIDPETMTRWQTMARAGKPRPSRSGRNGLFLRGPIPLVWLHHAIKLPGKALAVGLALWFLCGCREREGVTLTPQTLGQLGVGRKPGYRGLRALEVAGLVQVIRQAGKSPVVRICQVTGQDSAENSNVP